MPSERAPLSSEERRDLEYAINHLGWTRSPQEQEVHGRVIATLRRILAAAPPEPGAPPPRLDVSKAVAWAVWAAPGEDCVYTDDGDGVDCLVFYDPGEARDFADQYESETAPDDSDMRIVTPCVPVWPGERAQPQGGDDDIDRAYYAATEKAAEAQLECARLRAALELFADIDREKLDELLSAAREWWAGIRRSHYDCWPNTLNANNSNGRLLRAIDSLSTPAKDDTPTEFSRLRAEVAALKAGKWAGRWERNIASGWLRGTGRGVGAKGWAASIDRRGPQWFWQAFTGAEPWPIGTTDTPEAARAAADAALRAAGFFLEDDQ